jgi:hypothetical protein
MRGGQRQRGDTDLKYTLRHAREKASLRRFCQLVTLVGKDERCPQSC